MGRSILVHPVAAKIQNTGNTVLAVGAGPKGSVPIDKQRDKSNPGECGQSKVVNGKSAVKTGPVNIAAHKRHGTAGRSPI